MSVPDMKPFNIESLLPSDTPAYMLPAWLGCIHFALGEPDLVEQFRADTGNDWQPAVDGFSALIDDATGAPTHFLRAFIEWVNVNVWGPIDGPGVIQ